MLFSKEQRLVQELRDLVSLGKHICSVITSAKSFMVECGELRKKVGLLSTSLITLIRSINSAHTSLYLRPVDCMVAKLRYNYNVGLAIVDNCKQRNLVYRFFNSCNVTQFRQLFHVLDACLSDMEWLINLYEPQSMAIGSPANTKSPTFLVWSCIANIHMGIELKDRIEAAKFLILLAKDKNEYKNIIFEEGGVPPLQKLLKEKSPDAQSTAANALCLLANDPERKKIIMEEMVSAILQHLSKKSPVRDQNQAANLVASMAEQNPDLKEYDLIRENVIWRLVTLLSSKESTTELKISCSKALWMLARGSVSNCRTLTETKGMLCLADLVKTEQDELQYNCLMVIREITDVAESNKDFRHSTFKSSSLAAKAVVDELLRVIKEFEDKKLRIPAIKSIGSLARSFSARETRVLSPLVDQLKNTNQQVSVEAAIALQKFACTENHLHSEHSKSIIEFNGLPLLTKLLARNKKSQPPFLTLICYLAKHSDESNCCVLIKKGALCVLETTGREVVAEHPKLEKLVSEAIAKLQANLTDEYQQQLEDLPKVTVKQLIGEEQSKVVVDFPEGKLLPTLKGLVNLQGDRQISKTLLRCIERLLQGRCSLKAKKNKLHLHLQRFIKAKNGEMASRWKMEFPGKRTVMKKIVEKFRLVVVNSIVKLLLFEKKEIRRYIFGYVIHLDRLGVVWFCFYFFVSVFVFNFFKNRSKKNIFGKLFLFSVF